MWNPTELTPIQEAVEISADFQPSSFQLLSEEEKSSIEVLGKNTQGLTMAQKHDDESIVFI